MGFKTGFKRFLKNKFVLMAAGGLMALGLAGGAGLAVAGSAYGHGSGFGTVNDFAGRVAQQLNAALGLTDDREISAEQMQTAFSAATADLQEEHLQQKLDDAEVSAADAAAIMDWFRAWPYADLVRLRPIGFASSADRLERKLAHLVEKEWITQAQSDGIVSWFNDRPALPEGLERSHRGGRKGKGDRDGGNARHHHRGGDRDGDGAATRFGGLDFY